MKKWLSALLALAMVFTLLPVWSMGADAEEGGEESSWQFVPGHVSLETDFTYPSGDQANAAMPGLKRADRLPAKFDGRSMQTSVKNQLYNGLCWAFATTGAFESSLKVSGAGVYDFSELHVGYSLSNYTSREQGFNRTPGDGGNREYASAYFTRGTSLSGPIDEKEDPYVSEITTIRSPAESEGKTKLFTIGDIMYLTPYAKPTEDQVTIIKNAIMTYGGLDSAMRWPDSSYYFQDLDESQCWNTRTHAFYYYNTGYGVYANHEVLLVGWDDSFSRNNFAHKPSHNGAWLVKNSWGPNWTGSDGGYFWISYEDTCYPLEVSVFTGARPWTSDMYIYESDYKATDAYVGSGRKADYAKEFPIKAAGQEISSVRFYVPDGGSVKAYVDVIPSFTGFENYTFQAKAVKDVAFPGWYTVDLETPVQLPSSGSFAVVLRLEGTGRLMYDDANRTMSNGVKAYTRSGDGTEFAACTENICIKAIARASTFTATPAISGSVKTAGQLTATVTAPQGAKLVAISYDEAGKPLDIRITALTSSCECREIVLQLKAGSRYKLMLMDGTTFMPLCAAWSG